jgi:hypothetical protein
MTNETVQILAGVTSQLEALGEILATFNLASSSVETKIAVLNAVLTDLHELHATAELPMQAAKPLLLSIFDITAVANSLRAGTFNNDLAGMEIANLAEAREAIGTHVMRIRARSEE